MESLIQANSNIDSRIHNSISDCSFLLASLDLKNEKNILLTTENKNSKTPILSSAMSFSIEANPKEIVIYANNYIGLQNGLYYLLEQLGFRFYFPGKLWTISPKEADFATVNSEIVEPEFDNIDFFGSGAFRNHPILDSKNKRKKDWELWKKRMRFGNEFKLGGHAGEVFNTRNKKELEANPEYLAEIDGNRVKWSKNAKLCNSNLALRKLWLADRVQEYHNKKNVKPITISLEPSDGSGHCTCKECLDMGSVSNRIFIRSNEVAEQISKIDSEAKLTILAYNKHAEIPDVDIHPSIHIGIVPYAFQQISVPEDFINSWSSKTSNYRVYDYLGITPWNYDMPGINFTDELKEKLSLWKNHNSRGLMMESSYSIGALGLPLYMLNRLSWNLNIDPFFELETLTENLFGAAAYPMQEMFLRWSSNNYDPRFHLSSDIADIQKAMSLTKDETILQRIQCFENYLTYVTKYVELSDKGRKKERIEEQEVEKLLSTIWINYNDYFLHSSYLSNLITTRKFKEVGSNLSEKWTITNPIESTWSNLTGYNFTPSTILDNFNKKNPVYTTPTDLKSVNNNFTIYRKSNQKLRLYADHEFYISKNSDKQPLILDLEPIHADHQYANSIISIFSKEGKLLQTHNLDRDNGKVIIDWSDLNKGDYKINFRIRRCQINWTISSDFPIIETEELKCILCPTEVYFQPSHPSEVFYHKKNAGKKKETIENTFGQNTLVQSNTPIEVKRINGNGKFVF
jgi:hypothetical protein